MNPRLNGMLLSTAGVVLLSPDILVVRWVPLDHGSLLFWRGILLFFGFGAVALYRYRGQLGPRLREGGLAGLGCALSFALTTYCFTQSMKLTSPTAAMMIISTAPVFAAVLAWLWLRESASRRTLITIAITLAGIGIIVADKDGHNSLAGNLYALGAALFMAVNFNIARRAAPRDLSPMLILGGLFASALALLHTPVPTLPGATELGVMALTAALLMPIGFTLLQLAPRYIQATEVSLFLLLEAVLGPLWVWLVLGEAPGERTLLGSLVVCAGLLFHCLGQLPRNRAGLPPAASPPMV
ncbi:EamA family transporter [Zobellella denitrificans]|uniref:DMT family transporter n=1 Tax=Zobellella denitrificans TaxID=347534 RepID=UPI000B8BDE8B|nr:DMT family transporter [Zobellella denitrificans]OXS16479.1 EamA family transporter [Zobellella denitrificans]